MNNIFLLVIFLIIALFYTVIVARKRAQNEQTFFSIVNHAFRTPLTRIKWMSSILSKEGVTMKEQIDNAMGIENATNRLLEIIDILAGINDIKNISTYNFKAISLREMFEEAISKYRTTLNEKNIKLVMPTFQDIPLLTIDTKKIAFVIHTAIENSIIYNKSNGHIEIKAILLKNKVRIEIVDDGIGLSKKDKARVSKKFYRGDRAQKIHTDGMGLGLYLSKEIIKRHNGRLEMYSSGIDKGSVCDIELPVNN